MVTAPKIRDSETQRRFQEFQKKLPVVKQAQEVLRAYNHQLRQAVIALIKTHNEINVTAIYTNFNLEQAVVSQHLRILREAGLVKTRRKGKEVLYSVNQSAIDHMVKQCSNLAELVPH